MYLKIFNKQDNRHGFQYKDGLNIDTVPFNSNPHSSCVEGGLYFTTIEFILTFLHYGEYLRVVEPIEGETILQDPDGNKWRTPKLFLYEKKPLSDVETWKFLAKQGADVTAYDNYAVRWASENGHLEVVKFLAKQGADVTADDNYAVRWASENGHLEVVKFLAKQGASL